MPEEAATKNKGGRPEGSVATPRSTLRNDMLAASRLNKGIRELIESQLKYLKQAAAGHDLSVKDRLEIVQFLTQGLQNNSKGMEGVIKLLLTTDDKDSDAAPEESIEKIMEQLKK